MYFLKRISKMVIALSSPSLIFSLEPYEWWWSFVPSFTRNVLENPVFLVKSNSVRRVLMQSPNFQVFIGKLGQLIKCYTIKSSVTYLGVLRSLATDQIHLGSSLVTWEIFSEQDLKETDAAYFFSPNKRLKVYF